MAGASAAKTAGATMSRAQRREAVQSHKRAIIIEAAKTVFASDGLEQASLRKIAGACGYTPAAIYFYFSGKEELYAAILSESLEALAARLAMVAEGSATEKAGSADTRAAARDTLAALFAFYRERPEEFDLSYYLFQGVRPRGLTSELNQRLNGQLKDVLHIICARLSAHAGKPQAEIWPQTVACLVHASGLVLLRNSGRLKVLGVDDLALETLFIDDLVARLDA